MEHAYLEMARACGVRAARSRVLVDEAADGRARHHLFVERFDCESGSRGGGIYSLSPALSTRGL